MNLRDAMARITRALEALAVGDRLFAEQVLEDLVADLWRAIEAEEKTG